MSLTRKLRLTDKTGNNVIDYSLKYYTEVIRKVLVGKSGKTYTYIYCRNSVHLIASFYWTPKLPKNFLFIVEK